jgi:hypothetical protein
VTEFVRWLWTGSSASKVTSVEVHEVDVASVSGPAGFHTA